MEQDRKAGVREMDGAAVRAVAPAKVADARPAGGRVAANKPLATAWLEGQWRQAVQSCFYGRLIVHFKNGVPYKIIREEVSIPPEDPFVMQKDEKFI